jgi:hypothetical protein
MDIVIMSRRGKVILEKLGGNPAGSYSDKCYPELPTEARRALVKFDSNRADFATSRA